MYFLILTIAKTVCLHYVTNTQTGIDIRCILYNMLNQFIQSNFLGSHHSLYLKLTITLGSNNRLDCNRIALLTEPQTGQSGTWTKNKVWAFPV